MICQNKICRCGAKVPSTCSNPTSTSSPSPHHRLFDVVCREKKKKKPPKRAQASFMAPVTRSRPSARDLKGRVCNKRLSIATAQFFFLWRETGPEPVKHAHTTHNTHTLLLPPPDFIPALESGNSVFNRWRKTKQNITTQNFHDATQQKRK